MENAVVSNKLGELLANLEVRAAVFTTYTFEPEFFELDVIPLLLPGNTAYSADPRVKTFQVREALLESTLKCDVFYDLSIFRQQGQTSPAMEYLCHSINAGGDAFHAKLVWLLVYDAEHDTEGLLVGAGSNNLTQAGWWDNIECQHWEQVWPGEASRAFINRLQEDAQWLAASRRNTSVTDASALARIQAFLDNCRGSNQAAPVAYYGINYIHERGNFSDFLRKQTKKLWSYNNWTLEIISPFFAEASNNTEHEFFYELGVNAIHLLLPMDQQGNALCSPAYFAHIQQDENIEWADWSKSTASGLGLSDQHYRRLHAKIYHFYNKKQSWVFVGSVNFTHKAMFNNTEAGFFVKLPKAAPLLQVLKHPDRIEDFIDPNEAEPGNEDELDASLPSLHLCFDWLNNRLLGATEPYAQYTVRILTPEGAIAIDNWPLAGTESEYAGNTETLQKVLKNSAIVQVEGFATRDQQPFAPHTVLLQQVGWSHKPQDLPELSAEQILSIYADLSSERRQLLLMNAKIRQLMLQGAAGEITAFTDSNLSETFFSEYAEIFHAFRQLKKRLLEALAADNTELVDYYLSGSGLDSLPTLISKSDPSQAEHNLTELNQPEISLSELNPPELSLSELNQPELNRDESLVEDSSSRASDQASDGEEQPIAAVTLYLVLLCARELYTVKRLSKRAHVAELLQTIARQIDGIKSSNAIVLDDNTAANRNKFFAWFETQFSKQYRSAVDS